MAERVGFEPTNELPHCWFSRPVLSTVLSHLSKLRLTMDFNIFFTNITQPQFCLSPHCLVII